MPTSPISRARSLRQRETEAERRLWLRLRDRRLGDHKFVRQLPIGPFFADFACRESKLVVELDGSQHAESDRDTARDVFLNRQGFAVLRFWNDEVFTAMPAVCDTILAALEGRLEPFERYAGPSSALSGTFSPQAGRRGPLDAERSPSPRRGEGVRRTDEGTLAAAAPFQADPSP